MKLSTHEQEIELQKILADDSEKQTVTLNYSNSNSKT